MAGRARCGVGEIVSGPSIKMVEWKITDYFDYPQDDAGYRLESNEFNFLEADWCLRLYPGGDERNQSNDFISVYLIKKRSSTPKLLVEFKIQIVQHDKSNLTDKETEYTFEKDDSGFGWSRFLDVSELNRKKNEIVPNGVLTVLCTISSNTPKSVHTAVQTQTLLGVENLVDNFKNLLLSGEVTDVTLNVKNREYKAHRAVLVARSSVFAPMLTNDWKEKNSGVVLIEDCDPDAFQEFLTYLYTGAVTNISVDNVFYLHYIAEKYQVADLKIFCVRFIGDNLAINVFDEVLSLSLRENDSELLEKVVIFLASNLKNILITSKWLSFATNNPAKANELLIKAVEYNEKQE